MGILGHKIRAFEDFPWRRRTSRAESSAWLLILTGLWAIVILFGFIQFARYESQPGEQVRAPMNWPWESVPGRLTRPTLVLAAHPKCPCTRASLAELGQIVAQAADRVQTYIVFLNWEGEEDSVEGSSWDDAQRIAGAHIIRDDGTAARRFGALTSGQTYLYDEHGKLVFQGGITPARGQVGDNAGTRAILSYLNSRARDVEQTPAYGCQLFSAKAQ